MINATIIHKIYKRAAEKTLPKQERKEVIKKLTSEIKSAAKQGRQSTHVYLVTDDYKYIDDLEEFVFNELTNSGYGCNIEEGSQNYTNGVLAFTKGIYVMIEW